MPVSAEEITHKWHYYASKYNWQLQPTPESMIDSLRAKIDSLGQVSESQLKMLILRYYSLALWTALTSGSKEDRERAAQDLWSICMRHAIRKVRSQDRAEEIAQLAMIKVLSKIDEIKAPEAIIGYTMVVVNRLCSEILNRVDSIEITEEAAILDGPELRTEEQLMHERIVQVMREVLENDIMVAICVRNILYDEPLRDIAKSLGISSVYARVTKLRSLRKLRESPVFMELLKQLQ